MKTARVSAGMAAAIGSLFVVGGPVFSDVPTPRIGPWGVDLEGMDRDVRPQDDFFRHTNGGWLRDYEIPEDLAGYGAMTELWLESERHLEAIIEDVAAGETEPGTEAQKIADLYRDYLNTDALDELGMSTLEADLARIAAAETLEDVVALLGEYSRFGFETPFRYDVDQDLRAPDRYIAYLQQGGIGLPDREYYLSDDFASSRGVRREWLGRALAFAGVDDAERLATEVLALERAFARAHWPTEKIYDVEATYNKLTSGDLETLALGFPWRTYLEAAGLQGQDVFIVQPPDAFQGMAEALAAAPMETLRAFLTAELVDSHAAWLSTEVQYARFDFSSRAFTGIKELRSRDKRAVQFVNRAMGHAVGKRYVERHFSPEAKRQMDEMVANLLVAMGERIDGLDWMSDETKRRARDKLSRFTVKIGYPDEWRDYSELHVVPGDLVGNARRARIFETERKLRKLGTRVNRAEWWLDAQTVNAYYNPPMNEIVFPAAILQPPFFDAAADPAANYGAIGAVIGHEIGHGFDDQGRKFDGDGVLRDWWLEEDAARFEERSSRLVQQFDGFCPQENLCVSGQLTLGENIGDVGGVEIALDAYRLSLDGDAAPVIDGFTGVQRFFLAYGQSWRGKVRPERLASQLTSDPHAPVEYRVNGALPNVDAWYEAFDVQAGDALYLPPEHRVRIW